MTGRRTGEEGAALITVIALTAILSLIASVALAFASTGVPNARRHQDWNAALAAAEAGLDDYLARLNRNPGYYQTATVDDPQGDIALVGWAELPDSEGAYHYRVDTSRVNAEGIVLVTSVGRVGQVTRTVQATFRPAGFLDFIYFTDYEIRPPALSNFEAHAPAALAAEPAGCVRYHAEGRRDERCSPPMVWQATDEVRGPLHSNDALLIGGDTQFLGPVTTNWRGTAPGDPDNQLWRDRFDWYQYSPGSVTWQTYDPSLGHTRTLLTHSFPGVDPNFAEGGAPRWAEKLTMPPSNASIAEQTTSATGGCIYYGPTYIHVDGDRMQVNSPLSGGSWDAAHPTNPHCLGASATDWIDLPPNGVIYVADANKLTNPCGASTHPLGLPNPGDVSEYPCDRGDVFVWGELEGQLTIAAQHDAYVIADLTYRNGWEDSDDLLGLVADRYVQVWHPVSATDQNLPHTGTGLAPYLGTTMPSTTPTVWNNPTIHAAILSLRGAFIVQNANRGAEVVGGEVSIRGAIAQKFRGPLTERVRVGSDWIVRGYPGKDYVYDYRLQHLSPPYFIEPVESQWRQRTWAELPTPDDLPPAP